VQAQAIELHDKTHYADISSYIL